MGRISEKKRRLMEIDELKNRLVEYEETLRAIRAGVVDAVVVSDEHGERIFSLQSVDYSYRVMVENMNEGAVTLDGEGFIVFVNRAFSALIRREMASLVGMPFGDLLPESLRTRFTMFLQESTMRPGREEFSIVCMHGDTIPVSLSGTMFEIEGTRNLCLIVSDLTERKKAEQTLRDAYQEVEKKVRERTAQLQHSEERLSLAQQAGGIGTFEWDLASDTIFWTPEMEMLYGLRPGSFGGSPEEWERYVHPDDLPKVREELAQGIQCKEGPRSEYRIIRPDTSIRWIEASSRVFCDAHGTVVRMIGINKDITGRKQAEEALRVSRERYRAIVENSRDAIIVTDPTGEGRILSVNSAASVLFGWTREEMVGLSRKDILDVNDPDLERFLRERTSTGAVRAELTYKRRDGSTFIGELTSGFYEGEGKQLRAVGIIRDITERKRIENTLRESEARYRLLFDSIDEGFIIIQVIFDENGKAIDHRYLQANPANERHTGLKNPVGKRARELVPGIEDFWFETYGRIVKTQKPERFQNYSEAMGRWFDVDAFPVGTPGENTLGILFTDITERKLLERRLQQQIDEIAAVNKELESFSYSISHDLRNPLRAMKGLISIVLEDYAEALDAEGNNYLQRIADNAEKMSRLIDDILSLSKIARQEIHPERIDLSVIAAAVVDELRQAYPADDVAVSIAGRLEMNADARLMNIVLSNLIGNAWKYSHKVQRPRIEVGATIHGERNIYYVRDNGVGFDMRYADRLFEPFKRLHSDKEFPGTGIGLAIVKRAIEKHRGRVWAESEPGKGATFYFTLYE